MILFQMTKQQPVDANAKSQVQEAVDQIRNKRLNLHEPLAVCYIGGYGTPQPLMVLHVLENLFDCTCLRENSVHGGINDRAILAVMNVDWEVTLLLSNELLQNLSACTTWRSTVELVRMS